MVRASLRGPWAERMRLGERRPGTYLSEYKAVSGDDYVK